MPHKHKRKGRNDADFELPPDVVARPLSVSKTTKTNGAGDSKAGGAGGSKKRKRTGTAATDDDTPKEFARLMNRMKPRPSAQTSARDAATVPPSSKNNKKRKKNNDSQQGASAKHGFSTSATGDKRAHGDGDAEGKEKEKEKAKVEIPAIMPGERMRDFAARVDQALPLKGLVGKGRGAELAGVKRQRTKLERKITRMQDEWRDTDRRYKERLAEAEEEEEIEAIMNGESRGRSFRILDQEDLEEEEEGKASGRKKGKKARRKNGGGGGHESDDDPWAALAKKRRAAEQQNPGRGLVGVHDVVEAPPQLNVQLKERLKPRESVDI